jgi:hypothetical protein
MHVQEDKKMQTNSQVTTTAGDEAVRGIRVKRFLCSIGLQESF